MSIQQVLEVVRRHHVFWHNELCRASDADIRDCEFFRRQCQDEVACLEAELGLPYTQRVRNETSRKRADSGLSNARPATTKVGGRSTGGKANSERRNPPRG
jgi:hypothetical protein